MTINIGGKIIDFTTPKVMSIINITPDSFFSGSRSYTQDSIKERIDLAIAEGADILDIGGYSSRPNATDIPWNEELDRIRMAMNYIKSINSDIIVSIDTFRSKVADAVIKEYGSVIINDISAGELDSDMIEIVGKAGVPYIAMHMRGNPATMTQMTNYKDIASEIADYFSDKISLFKENGIKDVIIDPGFGFAKTIEQNYILLKEMHQLNIFALPILAGISRKSMIYKPLNTTPEDSLYGTCALHWECLQQGASILRVHDTKAARQIIDLFLTYFKSNSK